MSENPETIREMPIGTDEELDTTEKETSIVAPNDVDYARIHSEIPTIIKWVLSISESTIENHRTANGEIVAVTARIPKGIIKLQGSARKSNAHSNMVSYGSER